MEELRDGPVTACHIKNWTKKDPVLSRVLQFVQHGWPSGSISEQFKPYWQKHLELSCQDGCLLWGNRVVIPAVGQAQVLEELHSAHPGATRMKRIARTLVWWLGIDKDIENEVKACSQCQQNQSSPVVAPLQPWSWPTRPWSRVHADFAGPVNGHMLFILIDAHSKWIEAHPLPSITSSVTEQCCRQIFATFGVPEVLVTDNGPSFVSAEFESFLKKNGIRHKTSAPYHPATNGLAERAVRIVKTGLKKMKAGTLKDKISRFLFSYRNTPQSTTDTSPAELLLGRKMRSPLHLLHPDLHKKVEEKQEQQAAVHNQHSRARSFEVGDAVYVKNFSQNSSSTPWIAGQVSYKFGTLNYEIALQDERRVRRHIDHIRERTDVISSSRKAEFTWNTNPETEFAWSSSPSPQVEPPLDPTLQDGSPTSPEDNTSTLPNPPPPPRYPSRLRRPPEHYAPLISH